MPRKAKHVCPDRFENVFTEYLEYMRLRGYRETTIAESRHSLSKTLCAFDVAGLENLSQITPTHIYSAFENDRHFSTPLGRV